jgi:hypothetical protein
MISGREPLAERTRLRDETPIALFRRNAFGYSDRLPLSNFKLPQQLTWMASRTPSM